MSGWDDLVDASSFTDLMTTVTIIIQMKFVVCTVLKCFLIQLGYWIGFDV